MNKCLSDQTSSEVANLTGSEANNFMGSNLKNYGLRWGEKEFIVTVSDIDNMVCFNLMQLAHQPATTGAAFERDWLCTNLIGRVQTLWLGVS